MTAPGTSGNLGFGGKNPGPGSSAVPVTEQSALFLPGTWLFASLPTAISQIPTFAFTTDQSLVVWNGTYWTTIASSSGSPSWSSKLVASFATTVNDANPTGWSASIARVQATPASGGSTLNGLVSTGFTDGQTVMFINESTTDSFTFASLSGSCPTQADRFFCPVAGVGLAPYSSVQITRDNGYWTFS